MKKIISMICAMSFLASPLALAEDNIQQIKTPSGTFVTLSSFNQKKVEQDLLVASLRIELDNTDSRKLQDEVNKAMKKVMDFTKSESSIKVATGSYNVYSNNSIGSPQPLSNGPLLSPQQPVTNTPILSPPPSANVAIPSPPPLANGGQQNGMIWKGSQTIDLQSKDAKKLLEVVKKIQESGFVMNSLGYTLSPELMEAQKDELLVEALKKIKSKAELVSKTLGKSGYDIVDVNVDGNYMPPSQPNMMMRGAGNMEMMGNPMSTPVASPGETEVGLSVSARILLKP